MRLSASKYTISNFNQSQVRNILTRENAFLRDLFTVVALPTPVENEEEEQEQLTKKKPQLIKNKTSRATSLTDLQNRLENLKKGNATYNEKRQKKNLKNKLKKKLKQNKRNVTQKIIKEQKSEPIKSENEESTEHNKEDKMVFSKINFEGLGKKKEKKIQRDPKKLLEKVEKIKEKVEQLKATGETDKAVEVSEKIAWKNAIAKAEGIKIKDDPILLKKSIKKLEQKKRSSKKKWEARLDAVKKDKEERQKKRSENIAKRKKEKKVKKLKKASKKGKIIPGF